MGHLSPDTNSGTFRRPKTQDSASALLASNLKMDAREVGMRNSEREASRGVIEIAIDGPFYGNRTGQDLQAIARRAMCEGHGGVLLDLARTSAIDAAAVGSLADLALALYDRGLELRLTNVPPRVKATLETLGLWGRVGHVDHATSARDVAGGQWHRDADRQAGSRAVSHPAGDLAARAGSLAPQVSV
jgi:anti-anti-sigma regulatory factor